MSSKKTTYLSAHLGKDALVGLFFVSALVLLSVFGYLMGLLGGFRSDAHFTLRFSFAGGVEVGSPVRVAGVKVGKVEKIEFFPEADPDVDPESREVKGPTTLRVAISVARHAADSVRRDSRFFVNMAGIIGERYIEISPGSGDVLPSGSIVRGTDPPRIDQLLSQGYGLFGKLQDFVDDHEASLSQFVTNLNLLLKDANKLMGGPERHKLVGLIDNLNGLTSDLRTFTGKAQQQRAAKFFDRLESVLEKADSVDKQALKKFLQEEGIRAHMF